MDKTLVIIELFNEGKSNTEIGLAVGLTPTRISQILIKQGLKVSNQKYNRVISEDVFATILFLQNSGKTVTEISKVVNMSCAGIRAYLKRVGLTPTVKTVNTDRPCLVCGTVFTPKYSDGVKKDKYKTCSKQCTSAFVKISHQKYTTEQINVVIELKKDGIPNAAISTQSGVKISKIKEIVKENGLFLSKEQSAQNAHSAKLAINPDAMSDMRTVYKESSVSSLALDELKKSMMAKGYEYISGFAGVSKPFMVKCLKCNKLKETSKAFTIVENSCMYCSGSSRTSSAEIEITKWVQDLSENVEKFKFKERAGGIEIDVYVPSLKIGIEYCGLYWHNEDSPTPRGKTYHFNKMVKANNEGIRLITIFEDEWRDRKDQVKGFLLSVLQKNHTNIYARKCEVKSVDKMVATSFLNDNHIQGSTLFETSIGLFHNEELVGLITGNKHHRQGHDSHFVLNRLVFKSGCSVVGGSSRLLKHLMKFAKDKGYIKIVSWSDNRWSEGNVYKSLGFTMEEILNPDYSYVKGPSRISKQSSQKKHLISKGAIGETENEMAKSLGYNRIWDCGKTRWTKPL